MRRIDSAPMDAVQPTLGVLNSILNLPLSRVRALADTHMAVQLRMNLAEVQAATCNDLQSQGVESITEPIPRSFVSGLDVDISIPIGVSSFCSQPTQLP